MEEQNMMCMCSGSEVEDAIDTLPRPKFIATTIVLSLVNVAVVFGNSLVIAAVCTTRKLRTVTNIFIVSLAFADLLLGCVVLPFSITNQVLRYWVFGHVMCKGWLAVDVWLSTASIINLCAISFDRYIAITRPIKYPNILSSRRAQYLTAGVWVSAFVICLPPLVGWRDTDTGCHHLGHDDTIDSFSPSSNFWNVNYSYTHWNTSIFDKALGNFSFENTCHRCYCKCTLVDTQGYRLYSAMGSFFVPMLIMVFFYIRIYMAAVKTAASMRRGVLTTKSCDEMSKHEDEMAMRIHTGGARIVRDKLISNGWSKSRKTDCGSPIACRKNSCFEDDIQSTRINTEHKVTRGKATRKWRNRTDDTVHQESDICHDPSDNSTDMKQARRVRIVIKGGKSNIKNHNRKFRRETKAAKTLAIIVGAFILCWFPFFTIYLVGAFRADLIGELLFEVLFWLGYCNSAINPCIYAACAHDFRSAFRRILCAAFPAKPLKTSRNSNDVLKNPQTTTNPRDSESMSDS